MTGWGKEWNISKPLANKIDKEFEQKWPKPTDSVAIDWGKNSSTTAAVLIKDDKIIDVKYGEEAEKLLADKEFPATGTKSYDNQIPTHDPYTNPGAYLYYECKCGQRLDPHTKRFAELNNAAMKAGWKIRWGANSYVPYCVECGRDVE